MSKSCILLVFISLLLSASALAAAAQLPPAITERAIILGYGGDMWQYNNNDSGNRDKYSTIAVAVQYGADLARVFPLLKNMPGVLSFYLEPDVEKALGNGFEATVGIGLKYRLPVPGGIDAYISGSVGPAYVSILQDITPPSTCLDIEETLSLGSYYHLNDDSAIIAGIKFKHNSNGHYAYPNNFYNDIYFNIGYSWLTN